MDIETLAWAALKADIDQKEAKRQADELKAELTRRLEEEGRWNTDTKAIGNVRTKISNNRYFDLEEAESIVDPQVIEQCQVTKTDPKLLQQHMTPIQKEQAMKHYSNPFKLSLEVLKD